MQIPLSMTSFSGHEKNDNKISQLAYF